MDLPDNLDLLSKCEFEGSELKITKETEKIYEIVFKFRKRSISV